MADATEQQPEVASETPAAPAAKSPLTTVAKIAAFVVVVLTVEALIAFLLIPSADDVTAMAEARYGSSEAATDPVAMLEEKDINEPTVEIDLKHVTAAQQLCFAGWW